MTARGRFMALSRFAGSLDPLSGSVKREGPEPADDDLHATERSGEVGQGEGAHVLRNPTSHLDSRDRRALPAHPAHSLRSGVSKRTRHSLSRVAFTRIRPRSSIALASLSDHERSSTASFRSTMPPRSHSAACSKVFPFGARSHDQPTIWPRLLTPTASENGPPSVPRSDSTPPLHRNACLTGTFPLGRCSPVRDEPTTSPISFKDQAMLPRPPSVPKSCIRSPS